MNLEQDEDLKQDEELYALKKYVHVKKVDKKNIFKNLAEYTKERVNKKHSGYFDFLVYEKEIREKLQEGFTVQSVWYCLKKDGFIDCSLKTFQRYLNIKNEKPEKIKETIQQITQEDTATQIIKAPKPEKTVSQVVQNTTEAKETIDQKPEEQETNLVPEETQTTQEDTVIEKIEAQKPEETQPIEAKASQNQPQQEQETTQKETTQTVDPEKAKEQTSFENREFGKLPEGKVWKDLTDDEKDIIRKEREIIKAEENRKRLAENIEANRIAREEAERNKFRHDPDAKPPGYWENRES